VAVWFLSSRGSSGMPYHPTSSIVHERELYTHTMGAVIHVLVIRPPSHIG